MRRILALGVAALALTALIAAPAGARTRGVKVGDDFFGRPGGVTLHIHRGDRVRWRWTGHNPHTVTAIRGPKRFNSGIRTRGTYTHRFTRRGTYLIQCMVHGPMMRMRIVVR